MRSLYLLCLTTLSGVVTGDGFMARRQVSELNLKALRPEDTSIRSLKHEKRAPCGRDTGPCPSGQCCSEAGRCGTSKDYCTSPQCQIPYSNGNCDSSKKPSGETTANIPRQQLSGNVPYNVYITNCSEPGTVALTFDDGPYKFTDHILDVLEENNVKATFFIVGNNLGKGQIDDESTPWPRTLRRMHSSGHQLASHSWSHEDLSAATDSVRRQQILYNEMAFRNIFGWFPRYLRPPYGTCTRASGCLDYVTRLGYHVVNWNVDTRDYQHDSPGEIQASKDIFSEGLAAGAPSYIELSHDVRRQTAYNLTLFMIRTLRERGYRAVTVGECLGDPPGNWYVDARGDKPSASNYGM
ncbi:hypothetical protein ACJ41O_000557 [Fusarium nematophilum]